MRRFAPLLLILLAHCAWQMEPPPPIRGFQYPPAIPLSGPCYCSPVSERHGWTETSGLEEAA